MAKPSKRIVTRSALTVTAIDCRLLTAFKINKYGTFYLVEGELIGITGSLAVVTVWLKRTQNEKIQFITLKPKK